MGHFVQDSDRMFRSTTYRQKTTPELRTALEQKVQRVNDLLAERAERVKSLCETFEISDQELTNLVLQHQDEDSRFVSYEPQGDRSKPVPAGAIANIIQEKKMTESERAQLRKLELVLRNLQETEYYSHPETGILQTRECIHELTDSELEYLGF